MIPFGHWRPDAAGINKQAVWRAINVLPDPNGFRPARDLSPASANALDTACLGAAVVIDAVGAVSAFAGSAAKLWRLNASATFQDVSRTTGGAYAVAAGERWRFDTFGSNVIAVAQGNDPQKFTLGSSSNFTALGGTPPRARYIAIVRDFVFLGCLDGAESTVRWSGINNAEHWTGGVQSSGSQLLPSGGPIRGMIGGEVVYIWQATKVTRGTFTADSLVFSFDEVEGGRGLAAPASLVQIGRTAYYLSSDAFYKFDLGAGASEPIGVNKWERWVRNDIKPGTEPLVVGGADPLQRHIVWAYVPKSSSVSDRPSRAVVYDWALDEATVVELPIRVLAQWLTQGVTLDGLDVFGTLDALPFPLDSPVWRGGAPLLAAFGTDNKLSFLSGASLAAEIETSDGQKPTRHFITGTRPTIDTGTARVALASRERDGDALSFHADEAMEDTGICPAHISGNIVRAKVTVPAGATWTLLEGLTVEAKMRGRR